MFEVFLRDGVVPVRLLDGSHDCTIVALVLSGVDGGAKLLAPLGPKLRGFLSLSCPQSRTYFLRISLGVSTCLGMAVVQLQSVRIVCLVGALLGRYDGQWLARLLVRLLHDAIALSVLSKGAFTTTWYGQHAKSNSGRATRLQRGNFLERLPGYAFQQVVDEVGFSHSEVCCRSAYDLQCVVVCQQVEIVPPLSEAVCCCRWYAIFLVESSAAARF